MKAIPSAFIVRLVLVASISASFGLLVTITLDVSRNSLVDDEVIDDSGEVTAANNVDTNRNDKILVSGGSRMKQMWIEYDAPFQPFVDNEPKSVIILTYQRSGSSFFGQMFNSNPNAFYMFEPLDSLYSALYGTSPGWNVPSDITNYWNGTQRVLPPHEVKAVATFLGNIFTCSIDALPTETIAHRYWTKFGSDHAASADYVQCLRRRNMTLVPCHENTVPYCGKRFGEQTPSRLVECNKLLWSEKYRNGHGDSAVRQRFVRYRQCMDRLRSTVESECVSMLESDCTKSDLRAVKTVRATMASMEELLKSHPNFRIIHLIRDPRAVALSRFEFDSSARGQFSNKAGADKMRAEAMLYCRWAADDVRTRRRLSAEFPGRIYPIMYDDVVRDLSRYTRSVHRFLDERVHAKTHKWIANNGRRKRNGTSIATRWQDTLTVNQNEQILDACAELFELLRTPDNAALRINAES